MSSLGKKFGNGLLGLNHASSCNRNFTWVRSASKVKCRKLDLTYSRTQHPFKNTIFATSLVHKLLTAAIIEVTRENLYINLIVFKGYLRYKTITSQNVISEAQVKNFLSCRKVMFRSQDVQAFVFITIS